MVGDRSKKLKLSENPEEADSELIKKLQEIQDSLEKINDEASDKVVEIEHKYNEIRKPVYDKRNEIINSIPDFWLNVFLRHPTLSRYLNEEDQKYLSSLEVEDNKDVTSGYTITLNFNQNPYFEDSKLSKTFTFLEEGTTNITTTPIRWKEGKGIPNGVDHEKNGNKWTLVGGSFLSWFFDCEQKDSRDEVTAQLIKDDLWSYPLIYFNNGELDEENGDDETDDEEKLEDDFVEKMKNRATMRKTINKAIRWV